MKNRAITAATLFAASLPAEVWACSVCFDATSETRGAFVGTTIFLSLFPLGIMGGIGWYVWHVMNSEPVDDPTSGQ